MDDARARAGVQPGGANERPQRAALWGEAGGWKAAHGLHAEVLVVLLPRNARRGVGRNVGRGRGGTAGLEIEIPHLLAELHVRRIRVGHSDDHHAPAEAVAEVDSLRQLAAHHAAQDRAAESNGLGAAGAYGRAGGAPVDRLAVLLEHVLHLVGPLFRSDHHTSSPQRPATRRTRSGDGWTGYGVRRSE